MTGGPVRVGMNLLWLRSGVVGGSEVAAVGTIRSLLDLSGQVALHLYVQRNFVEAYPDLVSAAPTRTVSVPGGSRAARAALESTWLPAMAHRDGVDVLHCYGGVTPMASPAPTVLTIHDVQPLETVSWFNESTFSTAKRRWLGTMIPRSVAHAKVVLVPSHFVRDRLISLVEVDPGKVVVVPHGWSKTMLQAECISRDDLRRRFGLNGAYVLYPAISYGHKNHSMLVEAFASVVTNHPDACLVLTGSAGPAESDLVSTIERLGVGASVRRVGRVAGDELRALLRHASALAFPSRYEGFGLPVLEAFAMDIPVVAARAGSLPEVVGQAGVLLDPDDVAGWAGALADLLDGSGRSVEDSGKRRSWADRYRWSVIVPDVVDIYRRVAGMD